MDQRVHHSPTNIQTALIEEWLELPDAITSKLMLRRQIRPYFNMIQN
jgi:hypothetical protein